MDGTLTHVDYIDILDHNLLDFIENMYLYFIVTFIFQHEDAPVDTARDKQTGLDEHYFQMMA